MNSKKLNEDFIDILASSLSNKINNTNIEQKKKQEIDTYFKKSLKRNELKLIKDLDYGTLSTVKSYHLMGESIKDSIKLAELFGNDDVVKYYLWDSLQEMKGSLHNE